MRVAVTCSAELPEHKHWFENMPTIPRVGETIYFNERAWKVGHVAFVPENDEEETPGDTAWRAELLVR